MMRFSIAASQRRYYATNARPSKTKADLCRDLQSRVFLHWKNNPIWMSSSSNDCISGAILKNSRNSPILLTRIAESISLHHKISTTKNARIRSFYNHAYNNENVFADAAEQADEPIQYDDIDLLYVMQDNVGHDLTSSKSEFRHVMTSFADNTPQIIESLTRGWRLSDLDYKQQIIYIPTYADYRPQYEYSTKDFVGFFCRYIGLLPWRDINISNYDKNVGGPSGSTDLALSINKEHLCQLEDALGYDLD